MPDPLNDFQRPSEHIKSSLSALRAHWAWFVAVGIVLMVLGATLIGAGAFRLWVWFNNRGQQGWGWLAFSGLITFLAGLLIAIGWPANSLIILGLLLGFDLLFQEFSLLFAGLALRKPG